MPAYVVPDEVAERLTGYRVHRGALASMRRVQLPAVAAVLADARRIVVLEDLVDHGNVGAIFRCAAALDIDAVILSPRCADPLYRRSVKVSMGAVFAIPYSRMTDWRDGLAELRAAGFALLALTPDERATPITEAFANLSAPGNSGPGNGTPRAGLLLGTEGDGLSSRWLHEADEAVRIPMSPAPARPASIPSMSSRPRRSLAAFSPSSRKVMIYRANSGVLITEEFVLQVRSGGGEAALSISENQDATTREEPGSFEAEQDESGKRVPAAAKWGMAGLLLIYGGLGTYALISTADNAGPGHPEGVTRSVVAALGKSAAPSRSAASGTSDLRSQLANIKSASGAGAAAAMATAPAQPAAPPDEVLTAISATAIGPDGASDGDHPDLAALVVDPHSTMSWVTHWYETAYFGNLQDGTGLLLDMGRPVTIKQIEARARRKSRVLGSGHADTHRGQP